MSCASQDETRKPPSSGGHTLLEEMCEAFPTWLFDLDGVVTDTASIHGSAWKSAFDHYLQTRSARTGEPFVAFDGAHDYHTYVDGRPRYEGVDCFLRARGIGLDFGTPEDSPTQPAGAETVCGIGNRKNVDFNRILSESGVYVFPGSLRLLQFLKDKGKKIGLVTSSKNAETVLKSANLMDFFPVRVDGAYAAKHKLSGKPQPDTFLEAARMLDTPPADSIVLEDALSGVQAGRAGGFGLVIGVDRRGESEALLAQGAGLVVPDLGDLFED